MDGIADPLLVIVVHFDGSCDPNPGGDCFFGFVVRRGPAKLHEESGLAAPRGPGATCNVAEYTGCIRALEWLEAQGLAEALTVCGDSQLVLRQLQGRYAVRSPLLAPLHRRAADLLSRFPAAALEWIPREQNAEADRLASRRRTG